MTEEQYIIERVDDQIEWYEKKSATNKSRHLSFNVLIIVFAAFIPLISGFSDEISLAVGDWPVAPNLLVAVFGVFTSIFTGISALNKYQEKWTTYRITGESLKREKLLYQTRTIPYNTASAFNQFVRNIENLMSEENTIWTQIVNQQEDAAPPEEEA